MTCKNGCGTFRPNGPGHLGLSRKCTYNYDLEVKFKNELISLHDVISLKNWMVFTNSLSFFNGRISCIHCLFWVFWSYHQCLWWPFAGFFLSKLYRQILDSNSWNYQNLVKLHVFEENLGLISLSHQHDYGGFTCMQSLAIPGLI